MATCPTCGEVNPEQSKFCFECGTSLASKVEVRRETRRRVTIVFSDLEGSTSLGERLEPETLRAIMARYFSEMSAAVERHGGTVEKFIGDAVMAVWGIPRLHEDDALRAVRAAADMDAAQQRLNDELHERYGVRLRVRTGVNTGVVVAGDPSRDQPFATGDAVNVAARLEQAASAGEILIGVDTYALVRDAVDATPVAPLSLKGKSEPVPAFRLVAVRADEPAARRGEGAPLVGRRHELEALRAAFARAVSLRHCERVTIVGAPRESASRGSRRSSSPGSARLPAWCGAGACPTVLRRTGRWPRWCARRRASGRRTPRRRRAPRSTPCSPAGRAARWRPSCWRRSSGWRRRR